MEKVQIIGNLTKDPEQRSTASGQAVTNFDVAVNPRPSKAQCEAGQRPPAKYFRVAAWNELGEICAKYLAKGRKVYVEGVIRANAYTGNDGQPHASLELTANNVEFLSGRNDDGGQADVAPTEPVDQQSGMTQAEMGADELPF